MRTGLIALITLLAGATAFAGSTHVWVVPFVEADVGKSDWLSHTFQQSLSDELASSPALVVSPAKNDADSSQNLSATLEQAKAQGIDYVISATLQRINGELRITGQVDDARTGQSAGGFSATGSDRDLFSIEDSIALRVLSIVSPKPTTQPVANQVPFAPPPTGGFAGSDLQRSLAINGPLPRPPVETTTTTPPTAPVQTTYPPYTYPTNYGGYGGGFDFGNPFGYGYSYGSPYGYGYPYGYGGGSTVIITGNGNGHHHHQGNDNRTPIVGNSAGQVPSIITNWQQRSGLPSANFHTAAGPLLVPSGPTLVPNTGQHNVPSGHAVNVPSAGAQNVPSSGQNNTGNHH